jgi:hypothetical protein
MFMYDREGVLTSVLYGLDRRTRLTPASRNVLFTVYAPSGIGEQAVRDHLQDILENVRLISPQVQVEELAVFTA